MRKAEHIEGALCTALGWLVSEAVPGVLGSAQCRTSACMKRCHVQTVRNEQFISKSFTVRKTSTLRIGVELETCVQGKNSWDQDSCLERR